MIEHGIIGGILRISVLVVPRASRSEVTGEHEGALRIRIAAPPVEGAANKELVKVIAKYLGVAKRDVEISSGAASRRKTVTISGEGAKKAAAIVKKTL